MYFVVREIVNRKCALFMIEVARLLNIQVKNYFYNMNLEVIMDGNTKFKSFIGNLVRAGSN